jgi:hypothetical protein
MKSMRNIANTITTICESIEMARYSISLSNNAKYKNNNKMNDDKVIKVNLKTFLALPNMPIILLIPE